MTSQVPIDFFPISHFTLQEKEKVSYNQSINPHQFNVDQIFSIINVLFELHNQ